MKCLIVIPSLMRAGAETQAIDLANGLSARGHSVHLCSFEPNLEQRNRITSSVKYHHVRREAKYDLSFTRSIATIVDDEQIDVIQGVLMFGLLVAWLSSKRSQLQPPVVAAIHTTINRGWKQEMQDRCIYRPILARLPAIVFVCNFQREFWVAKYPELRTSSHVVYNGVDGSRFTRSDFEADAKGVRETLAIPETAFIFTCIAGFRPEKGHQLLIRAFSCLPDNVYLVLAGDGVERAKIQKAVRAAGIADRVRFLGDVPDVRSLIVASNATVLASTAVETFSMAMLESMALGVPMIAPDIGGLSEAIRHGKTGLLFPIGDVDALANGMKDMVAGVVPVREMGQSAANRLRSTFSLARMIEGSEEVLESVV